MGSKEITVVDLFSGAGGLTAGFHAASERFRTIAAVEMDLPAAAAYEATFGPGVVFAGPIQDWLESGAVPASADVVMGGPPCQGFSTLGKQDAEDTRNFLWKQYARALLLLEPKYFIVENVSAFARSPQFRAFQNETSRGGQLKNYAFSHAILNAADYGAPQARKRAVLIGHHRDLGQPQFPVPNHSSASIDDGLPDHKTVGQALLGVPLVPDMDGVFETKRFEFAGKQMRGQFSTRELHWSRKYQQLSLDRFAQIPAGGNRFDLPDDLKARCWINHRTGSGDVMGRLRVDKPAVTIRTEFYKPEKGRYLHPTADRAITHYEAAILQGFPVTHKFVGSKTDVGRQIGNAVPIPLAQAIGQAVLRGF